MDREANRAEAHFAVAGDADAEGDDDDDPEELERELLGTENEGGEEDGDRGEGFEDAVERQGGSVRFVFGGSAVERRTG